MTPLATNLDDLATDSGNPCTATPRRSFGLEAVAAVSRHARPARPPSSPKPAASTRRLGTRCPPPVPSTSNHTRRRLSLLTQLTMCNRMQRHTVWRSGRPQFDSLNPVATGNTNDGALGGLAPSTSHPQQNPVLFCGGCLCRVCLSVRASTYHLPH